MGWQVGAKGKREGQGGDTERTRGKEVGRTRGAGWWGRSGWRGEKKGHKERAGSLVGWRGVVVASKVAERYYPHQHLLVLPPVG
jgi:hypothetical protein